MKERKEWGKREVEKGECQEAHSFCWAPSGSGKVDKQWRELHPISFLKPEQTHTHHNAWAPSPPIQCLACCKHCQGLGLINHWPDTEQKRDANKKRGENKIEGSCKQQWETQMRWWLGAIHPRVPGLTLFNLVKSVPKSKKSPPVSWQGRNETVNLTKKGSCCGTERGDVGYAALCWACRELQLGNYFI